MTEPFRTVRMHGPEGGIDGDDAIRVRLSFGNVWRGDGAGQHRAIHLRTMRFRLFVFTAVAALASPATFAQESPPGTQRIVNERRDVCAGEFITGTDPEGSWVSTRCLLPKGSNAERAVARVCKPRSTCRVEATVRSEEGRVVIRRVIKVEQTQVPAVEAAAATPSEPYAQRLGKLVDGVYAPAASGCNSRHRPADRVSILLNVPPESATVQFLAQFCAVVVARGADPTEKSLRSTLEVRCGPESAEEQMRKGKTGRKTDIVISKTADQPLAIDGVPYATCPIAQSSTPEWWVKRHPQHQGKFPQ